MDIHGCPLAGSQPLLLASPNSESVLLHGPETGLCIKTGHLGCTISEMQSASFMPVSWILPEGPRIGHWTYLLRGPSSPRTDQGHCTHIQDSTHMWVKHVALEPLNDESSGDQSIRKLRPPG